MDAVSKYLLKKNGALLLYPAYTKPDKMIGYLSRYAPGRRENGGVYTHAATWAIWAYSKLKQSELAFEAYKRLSPVYNGLNPDEYRSEERRVGKECRCRWSPEPCKQNVARHDAR